MQAAVVESFGVAPRYTTFREPEALGDEVMVRVLASALSNLVKDQASGSHYSKSTEMPFVAGNDGVGMLPDGQRVYFLRREPWLPQGDRRSRQRSFWGLGEQ